MWHRTQVGFEKVPQASAPLNQTYVQNHQNQLQFNLNHATYPSKMATVFRNPGPVIIEKLPSAQPVAQPVGSFQGQRGQAFSQLHQISSMPEQVFTSLSSDRLSFAVELAKRDLKSEKRRIGLHHVQWEEEVVGREAKKEQGKATKQKAGSKTSKKIQQNEPRVQRGIGMTKIIGKENYERYERVPEAHYPASSASRVKQDIPAEDKQAHEIRRLRRKIVQYAKRLEEIRTQGPEMLRKKDKRIIRKMDLDMNRLSDEESDPRQAKRAEEQAARSSRMLYMLQRQVQEIQDELNKKGKSLRHTRKSQAMNRLAAAHRGAVRALQMFINHAPLQPRVSQGLPPMYQELALLIKQLSLLTTELNIEPEDLPEDILSELLPIQTPVQSSAQASPMPKRKVADKNPAPAAFVKDKIETKRAWSEPVMPRGVPEHVAATPKINIERLQEDTPERDAVLRAGLEALLRVKETPVQQPKNIAQSRPKSTAAVASKKAVLLPSKLKANRQKAQSSVARSLSAGENVHFAQDTLAFQMKRAQGQKARVEVAQKDEEKSKKPVWTPPGTPRKSPRSSPGRSPRSPRSRAGEEITRASGKTSPRRLHFAMDPEMTEREVARQNWLDREADRQASSLRHVAHKEEQERLRRMSQLREQLISEAETEIRRKIQPLLDQAQVLAESERKTPTRTSLSQGLGQMASKKAGNQADLLTDLLLDDVLNDTVEELERLDSTSRAESFAESIQDSSTINNLWQRLQEFEKEEEEIRRHWTKVTYADNDIINLRDGSYKQPVQTQAIPRPRDPKPMKITADHCEVESLPGTSRIPEECADDDTLDTPQGLERVVKIAQPVNHHSASMQLTGKYGKSVGPAPLYPPSSQQTMGVHSASKRLALPLSDEIRASIAEYKDQYEQYLKRTATVTHGAFDPWQLVESISDEIVEEAMQEVVDELDDVCEKYTEALYSDEFKQFNGQ